ncbi:hypothetical protein P8452_70900 [Trifolium repens]|nr:hypothetical protein P8452_70900 [Trifolium repens]
MSQSYCEVNFFSLLIHITFPNIDFSYFSFSSLYSNLSLSSQRKEEKFNLTLSPSISKQNGETCSAH